MKIREKFGKILAAASATAMATALLFTGTACADGTNSSMLGGIAGRTAGSLATLDAKGQYYTDFTTMEEAWQAGKELSVEIAEEGDVLLKNENNALPLRADERKVTIFGMASNNLIKAGGGSGAGAWQDEGSPPVRITRSTVQSSLEDAGFSVNPKTVALYESYTEPDTIADELPVSYYGSSVTNTYRNYDDAAIITFDRIGTENSDLKTNNVDGHANPDEHYLQLEDNERALIRHVKSYFSKVIVLLNSANIMQIPDLAEAKTADNLGVDAVLWVGTTGNNAIDAVGRILNGEVNPSGKTVDLWARDFTKAPTWTNFGHQDQNKDASGNRLDAFYYTENGTRLEYKQVEYREDIYMGYRYYETVADEMSQAKRDGAGWYAENVLYPFGYGLSYTSFSWELIGDDFATVTDYAREINVQVKVTNTGSVAGKDVVQLYYTPPYTPGGIEKASVNLVQFEKTDLLQPGESQTLTLSFVAQDMASYDYNDANNNGFRGYELEGGDYVLTARRDSHTPVLEMEIEVPGDIRCETDYATGNRQDPVYVDDYTSVNEGLLNNKLSRTALKDGVVPASSSKEERTLSDAEVSMLDAQDTYEVWQDSKNDPWYVDKVPDGWTQEVAGNRTSSKADILMSDMAGIPLSDERWVTFMNQLTWDEICSLVTSGTGSGAINYIGKSSDRSSDGPVQISGGTLFACAPITAATYNKELAYEMGRMVGNQCIFREITDWLGPGANIHRSPFSGRNFEYYSEDGVHGGLICAEVVKGANSKGVLTYLKHFFANDQESYRADFGGVATFATEQALREIYLKPFEYAIKFGGTTAMMSSFNRIGYTVTCGSYATLQTLLRDQLGFRGAVVTDAWTKDYAPINMMVRGGNDQLLGTGSNYPKNNLTKGVWSSALNCVMVPSSASDRDNSVKSATHYVRTRLAAQNILYTRANSIANNNCLKADNLEVTVLKGVDDKASIEGLSTSDVSVRANSGLPSGLSISGSTVKGNTNVAEGQYRVSVTVNADGWVETSGTMIVNVVSAIRADGENTTQIDPVRIDAGTDFSVSLDCPYYAYGKRFSNGQRVINCYQKAGDSAWYNRNEDKTAADILTIDINDATVKREINMRLDSAPSGVRLTPVLGEVMGANGYATYEVPVSWNLEGNLASGDYEVKVTLTVYTRHQSGSGWFSGGPSTVTYSTTIKLRVR